MVEWRYKKGEIEMKAPTPEQCEKLAEIIVDGLGGDELRQFVFEDIYSIMREDKDCFFSNLKHHDLELEDLDWHSSVEW